MKTKKQHIWKNYFGMLLKSKLPWLLMTICFLISLGRAELTLVFADMLGKAITTYANLMDAIGPLVNLFLVGISIVILKVAGSHLQGILNAKVERNIQKYAVSQVFYLKTYDIEKNDPREMVTRLTDDTSKSANFIIDLSVNEIPRIYYIVIAIIKVIELKLPVLTITLLAVVPVIVLGSYITGKIIFKNRNKVQQKIADLTAKLAEKIDNVEVIKSYSTEEKEIDSGNVVIKELDKVKKEGAFVDQINAFIKNMMWWLPLLLIIIPPAIYLFRGQLTQGEFYAYILIATSFRTYTSEHLQLWAYLKEAQGATLRLAFILSLNNEKSKISGSVPLVGDIEFKNVSFAYDQRLVLDDVSFTIQRGKKTAIIGLSGSGKTTILNLIEKFYDPKAGDILLNQENINNFDYGTYRSLFTYLPQNAPGFTGNVREMLSYASEEPYSDEELIDVLKKVDLYDDLEKIGGLDYEVGYGASKLSGGQRQKIGVARLLLSHSEYILLDEATSALDAVASEKIQKEIDEATKGRTEITVAHNLSTILNADNILVFNRGKLIDQGRHEELLTRSKFYQELLRGAE